MLTLLGSVFSENGNGFQLEKLRLNFFFQVVSGRLQIMDVNDHGLVSLCELKLCLPLDVQRKCSEWIKLASPNFQDSSPFNPTHF